MKLVVFQKLEARDVVPGLLTGGGEALLPTLERRTHQADPLPLSVVRLRAPLLPRPGKILACIAKRNRPQAAG